MFQIYDPGQQGKGYSNSSGRKNIKGKGFPNRGLCYQLSNRQGLLQLIGPSDLKTAEQGIPEPLLVGLLPDSNFKDMPYPLRQKYHFTYMSWQNFFPAFEPVTVLYSRFIARKLSSKYVITCWMPIGMLLASP
jgi:hypothetical protein